MMIDVSYTMTYLHEKNIVHADLKSDTILLRTNGIAVLSDFGRSKIIKDSTMQHNHNDKGAIRWLAPELCKNHPERCSFMSDRNDEVKILRACCTWSKKDRPDITKIIKDLHYTVNNDHQIQNKQNVVTLYKMEMSHIERQPSTRIPPQTSLQKNKALYDSED
ncbi:unnamed protein product [Adineta steineri]|uniref:Protein kinase domain-containing protein n=1 Tax=Adineta steineri TaxID=433720 RepID=A0A814PYJ3_9BILA|nr:unnamed protein product [Adineta steineri]CAF1176775.1 unnamed protein product [Adineta steineri]